MPFQARCCSPLHRSGYRFGPRVGPEHVAVDAAELHGRPVTGLGEDLVGGPVAVGQLEVDRRADASQLPSLLVELPVVQGVEHPPPGPLEAVEQVPLRLVVEQDDVELVAEARGHRLDAASQRIQVQRSSTSSGR